MSDTPRTDYLFTPDERSFDRGLPTKVLFARLEEHARRLEREVTALREALKWALSHAEGAEGETDFDEQYAKAYGVFNPQFAQGSG